MNYEYDYQTIPLTEEQQQIIGMGLGDVESLNILIKDIVNQRAEDGWEPLWPFMVPQLWFRRVKTSENN